jgi:hypothetical protein
MTADRLTPLKWLVAFALALNCPLQPSAQTSVARARQETAHAWTLDEARSRLALNPRDAYLQFVALQLARREGRVDEVAAQIDARLGNPSRAAQSAERRAGVDLFSIFTGALAVQESLQLDTMRGGAPPPDEELGQKPEKPNYAKVSVKLRRQMERSYRAQLAEWEKRRQSLEAQRKLRAQNAVPVAGLTGPTIKSHPWAKMLAGRKPEVSPLARLVPEDFYLVEFRSLGKLLEAADAGDLWGTHLFNQARREARTHDVSGRLKRQLALETSPLLRPFYDLVVEEVAVTGSDLFLREGSDVTLIFRYKRAETFKSRMEGFLADAARLPGAKREAGRYLDVDYTHVETPGREVSVFEAYPAEGVAVRSNSLAAFQRVLAAIKGKDAGGKAVRRLGETDEFAYVRTLMPRGASEEDGFVYLSDAFIRRLVGPELKLTERRRVLCFNHLKMIGHAALLHQTDYGQAPASLAELAGAGCAPGVFGEGPLACPTGGQYSLAPDRLSGVCSHHGHAAFLTPNIERPVEQVDGNEAAEYQAFIEDYNQYWRTYFDPIALRLKLTPRQYRLETVVLPLIDNSIYTGLAEVIGGATEPLDSLPVPRGNIFSLALRLNKESLLAKIKEDGAKSAEGEAKGEAKESLTFRSEFLPSVELERKRTEEFLSKGLGNQIGLHVYDSHPTFDLNLMALLGDAVGGGRRGSALGDGFELLIVAAVAALNAPIYLSVPVRDRKVVDDYIEYVARSQAVTGRASSGGDSFLDSDVYRFPLAGGQTAHTYALRFGPVKLRFFGARIGDGYFVATKPFILEDLLAAEAGRAKSGGATGAAGESNPVGHAMVRVRAERWDQVLQDYRLSWAENNREACLNNLSALAGAGRANAAGLQPGASAAAPPSEEAGRAARERAAKLYGTHFFCPEGGRYLLAADGKSVACDKHGDEQRPRQAAAPDAGSDLGKLMQSLKGVTATFSFLEDGLRAVVTIDRR